MVKRRVEVHCASAQRCLRAIAGPIVSTGRHTTTVLVFSFFRFSVDYRVYGEISISHHNRVYVRRLARLAFDPFLYRSFFNDDERM